MGARHSCTKRELTVTVCTWNLGNNAPTTGFSWLGASRESDIYAVGVQEAIYDRRDGFIDMEMDLFVSIHKELGEDKYDVIRQQSLTPRTDKTYVNERAFIQACREGKASPSGIRVMLLVKKSLIAEGWTIEDDDVNLQTCGRLGGVSGNKGGINVSFRIGETWLSFMSAHFNAHTEELERRILDYGSVMAGLHPVADDFGEKVDYQVMEADDQQYVRNVEQMNKCHVVFAFGDFNFRLEPMEADGVTAKPKPEDYQEVLDDVDMRQWDSMATYDQLLREKAKGRVFHGFVEKAPGHPQFLPTFKLNKKTGAGPWNPKRVPSWCDRVLWRSIGPKVECHKYVSHPEPQYAPNTSDHTPVSAWFSVEVRKAGINKAGLASSFSKMRSRGSSVKSRSMVITDLQYEPEITHIVPLYLDEDEPDKAAALGQIKAAQLYISMYHTSLKQRQKTKSQLWNDVAVKWSDTIKLDTQAAIEDITAHPLLICLRNNLAMENKTHRFGECMIDMRELYDSAAKGGGTFKVLVMQRGTPRGFISGKFEITGV